MATAIWCGRSWIVADSVAPRGSPGTDPENGRLAYGAALRALGYIRGMIDASVFRARRDRLTARVDGPILLLGNGERPRNLPMNAVPFRQDSTFLYFVGHSEPGATALIDGGVCTLFLPARAEDDALWHGPTESWDELAGRLGVAGIEPVETLPAALKGRSVRTLAVPDANVNRWASELLGRDLTYAVRHGDEALVDAVIAMRRTKDPAEAAELRRAADVSASAFHAVMTATHPGVTEQGLAALFEGVLALRGAVPGYGTILSVRGEVLHNHSHDNVCEDGQLLLLDGGGEVDTGYTVDITRTWPVSGTFSPRQRAAYQAVLEAQRVAIDRCRAGVRYREVHDAACRVLAAFLRDEGLLTCSVDEALETGAHGVFYPHGTGHLLGLDVHDLENFGDRPSYPEGQSRPPQFGTRYLRLDLPLQPGWAVTVEPGFYVVPAILDDARLRDSLGGRVDWEAADAWRGFGGIRIEDDVLVTDEEPEVLTAAVPKAVQDIEDLVGSGRRPEERLC